MNKKPTPKNGDLLEQTLNRITLMPLTEAEGASPSRRISAIGITADVLNRNGRMYPASVLSVAVLEAQQRMAQGEYLFGERDHPHDRDGASLESTCVNWDKITFDGKQVLLEGVIIQNEAGNDILAFFAEGIMPCVSQRGYGASDYIKQGDGYVEQILSLKILGYDLVVFPSDAVAGVTKVESEELSKMNGTQNPTDITPPLTVDDFKKQYGDVVAQLLNEEQQKREAESQAQAQAQAKIQAEKDELERQLREAAGVPESANLQEALKAQANKMKQIQEAELKAQIDTAITEAADKLKYSAEMKGKFVESVKRLEPHSLEEASRFIAATQIDYDARMAEVALKAQGYVPQKGPVIQANDVLESELGIPEFARAAFELNESLRKTTHTVLLNFKQPRNLNEAYAAKVLQLFASKHRHQLKEESRMWAEAETTADLPLRYSAAYGAMLESLPKLVSSSVFDFDTIDGSHTEIFFEKYVAETGSHPTVSSLAVVATLGEYVEITGSLIDFSSVVVTHATTLTTIYELGTDYLIDYDEGKFMALTGGAITNGQTVLASYKYRAYRNGEMQPIQRGKGKIDSQLIKTTPLRLATQISDEAMRFSRSQLGWDATNRTLSMLATEMQRTIDAHVFANAMHAVLRVENNSGGSYASTAPIADLVKMIGYAKVKLSGTGRYYLPTAIVMSEANSDNVGNWDGFTQAGSRPDGDLNANGFAGRLKGTPVFASTEFSDSFTLVTNRELVMHRVSDPMEIQGPLPSYSSEGQLVAANQYYMQQYSASPSPIKEKGVYIRHT